MILVKFVGLLLRLNLENPLQVELRLDPRNAASSRSRRMWIELARTCVGKNISIRQQKLFGMRLMAMDSCMLFFHTTTWNSWDRRSGSPFTAPFKPCSRRRFPLKLSELEYRTRAVLMAPTHQNRKDLNLESQDIVIFPQLDMMIIQTWVEKQQNLFEWDLRYTNGNVLLTTV